MRISELRKIYALTTERRSEQFSMTSCENSRLLWHIFSEMRTQRVISRQYSSTKFSWRSITSKILLKQRTDDRRLKGSGWFELLAIRRTRDRMLVGSTSWEFSWSSEPGCCAGARSRPSYCACLRLQLANSATALLHISLRV